MSDMLRDLLCPIASGVVIELIVIFILKLLSKIRVGGKQFWMLVIGFALAIAVSITATIFCFRFSSRKDFKNELSLGSNVFEVVDFQWKMDHVKETQRQVEAEIDNKLNQACKIIGVGLSNRWEKELSYIDKTSNAAVKALVEREFTPMLETLVKIDELRLHYHLEIRNHFDAKLRRGINLSHDQFKALCAQKDGCVKNMEKFLNEIIAIHVDGKKNLCDEVARHIKAHLEGCHN